jgi:lincosamide nucleotidyltransferase A/C/D/E
MTEQDVVAFVRLMDQHGITVRIDGGWGVDALLGEQTRSHSDLDIAVEHPSAAKICALLEERGYRDVPRNDTRNCNFVLGDDQGHLIDIHTYQYDDQGNLVFGLAYPLDSLTGSGSIGGYPVKCISVEWMVKFHSGYTLDENDYHDVKALCRRFNIPLPEEYAPFEQNEFVLKI